MYYNKMNMFWNQQPMSQQQNQFFQPPAMPGQFGGDNSQRLGQSLHKYPPSMGGQGGLPKPQENPGWNQGWGAGLQNAGGQGYTTPGYPPQGVGQQLPPQMKPMPYQSLPSHRFPTQGYPLQNYTPVGYSQEYGGQMPVQLGWEEPKKGGIKGFLSNLMAKRKR